MPIEHITITATEPSKLFVSKAIWCAIEADLTVGVYDTDGTDISDKVRSFTLCRHVGARFDYVILELNMPGFDGPFCTPAIDFH